MKQNLKVVSLVNFVRGGKSSIARLLAENLETSILNLDPKRDSEFYNAVKTTNIPENSTIKKKADSIELETEETVTNISSKSNFFICDFGGRFDERIKDLESDLYILPTMDDFESISETMRATKYILKHNPKAKILHILNFAMCFDKEEKIAFRTGYKANLEENDLSHVISLEMPRTKLLKKIVNEGIKESDIIGGSNFLKNGSYRGINSFIKQLTTLIKEELN